MEIHSTKVQAESTATTVNREKANKLMRSERTDLLQLIRQRERVAKAAAAARAAQLIADFESQLDRKYSFDNNETWASACAKARAAVDEAQTTISAECVRLGIPKEFAPSIVGGYWINRGENACRKRREDLRRLACKHIEANEKNACAVTSRQSVDAQTRVLADGFSDTGLAFLASLPTAEELMPSVVMSEIERLLPASNHSDWRRAGF